MYDTLSLTTLLILDDHGEQQTTYEHHKRTGAPKLGDIKENISIPLVKCVYTIYNYCHQYNIIVCMQTSQVISMD